MITDELNLVSPKDYSYVFGGLSPLSVKYVETLVDSYAPNLEPERKTIIQKRLKNLPGDEILTEKA